MSIEQGSAPAYRPSYPILTDQSIQDFGVWLKKFEIEKLIKVPAPDKIRVIDIQAALEAFGAVSKTGAIIVNVTQTNDWGGIESYERPTKWDLFYQKYDAYMAVEGRKQFGEQKRLEGLDEVAKKMGFGKEAEPVIEKKEEPKKKGYFLTRSGLNRYRETHGHEYDVPAGIEVVEDLPAEDETIKEIVDNF